jgi:restriction system protein
MIVEGPGVVLLFLLLAVALIVLNEARKRAARKARLKAIALSDVDNMNGVTFEHYVARLLQHQGFARVEVSKASGDFGVDIIACKGPRRYAIQVKRWSGTLSRTAISDAVAGKEHYRCNSAMVVTNSFLSAKAKQFASSVGCEIVDRDMLSEWILKFQGPGPAPQVLAPPMSAPSRVVLPPQPKALVREQPSRAPIESADAEPSHTIPAEVLQAIKSMAAADHPSDYSTQVYVIQEQIGAYERLRRFEPRGIPRDILKKMARQAAEDHPADYSTQMYVLEEGVESYFALGKLENSEVPGETLAVIKDEAARRHPYDFSTQLYVVQDQIEAYKSLGRFQ